MNEIMEYIAPMFVVAVIALSIVAIVKIVLENRVRMKIAEKGAVDADLKNLFVTSNLFTPLSSLKWGLIITAVGVALLLANFLRGVLSDTGVAALVFIFAGSALFIHYFLAKRLENEHGAGQ